MVREKIMNLIPALAAVLMLSVGCSREVRESITVEPEQLEVGADLSTCEFRVEANCPWTVSLPGNAAGDWILPATRAGSGPATVRLRVFRNGSVNERNARIAVSSPGGAVAAVSLKQAGKERGSVRIRVGSFNVRIPSAADSEHGDGWQERKPRLAQAYKDNEFDVFGIQECSPQQQSELPVVAGGAYDFWFFSPYSQNGVGKSAQGIAYRKDKFILSERHFFWACDTPDVMTTNDTGSNGTYNRGGCCAVLTHRETGISLFVMNSHGCLNSGANQAYAHVYVDMEKRYNKAGLPSVFVGDMNASYTSPASVTYRTWWQDSYEVLSQSGKISGPTGTYNAFDPSRDMNKASRIDFIYFRGPLEPLRYVCNAKKYDGHYPSDHLPVYCDFEVFSGH